MRLRDGQMDKYMLECFQKKLIEGAELIAIVAGPASSLLASVAKAVDQQFSGDILPSEWEKQFATVFEGACHRFHFGSADPVVSHG